MNDRIQARVDRLQERLAQAKISPEEFPAIMDRAFDVLAVALAAAEDGRLTVGEVASIWSAIAALRVAITSARQRASA